jgi:hypothetical protein
MVGLDMARLIHMFAFMHVGIAGAATRVLVTRNLITPGTLAFLSSAR